MARVAMALAALVPLSLTAGAQHGDPATVEFTFDGFDAITPGSPSEVTVTTRVTERGDLRPDEPLRLLATLTHDGEALAGETVEYETTDGTFVETTTDDDGRFFVPPPGQDPLTLADTPALESDDGHTSTLRLTLDSGDTELDVELTRTAEGPGTVTRLAGLGRVETAVALSEQFFEPGVPAAYVATARTFPDSLSGGPVASIVGGPVLLVEVDEIPEATADELRRLVPEQIVILGGPAVVGPGVEGALADFTDGDVSRMAGEDRYGTAGVIAGNNFAPGVATMFVATGLNFPDALSGGAAAADVPGPIVLVRPDAIPDATDAALRALDPLRIVILGGPAVVSDAVADQLAAYTDGAVLRWSGLDRFGTSATISAETFDPDQVHDVFVATGRNFPDAMTGTPPAGRLGAPLLLVDTESIPQIVLDELERLGVTRVWILGGTSAVSSGVEQQLQGVVSDLAPDPDLAEPVSEPGSVAFTVADETAPDAPTIDTVTDPVTSADETAFGASGTAEPGATVEVTVDDADAGTEPVATSVTADDGTGSAAMSPSAHGGGHWEVTGLDVSGLADGTLTVTVTATDASGNTSTPASVEVVKDTVGPDAPTIDTATDPVNAANDTAASVAGTAEPGATVDVSIDDAGNAGTSAVTDSVVADANGDWEATGLDVSGLDEGTLTVTATATDEHGQSGDPASVEVVKETVTPVIERTALTLGAGDGAWDGVGDELTVVWSEAATHAAGDGGLTEAQVEAVLGTAVEYAATSTVTLAGSGTDTWTLTVGAAALTEGVAPGDDTNGTDNADVTDGVGNPQAPATGVAADVGPEIVATALSAEADGDQSFGAVGDELTVHWSEPATHAAGDGALTEAQVEAVLGTAVEYAGGSTVTLAGSGTDTWILTVGGAALVEGVAPGDGTNGTDNDAVTDVAGSPQVAGSGVTVGVGPVIESAVLTHDADGDGAWGAVDDVLTLGWSEAATHGAGDVLDQGQVDAILGIDVTGGAAEVARADGADAATWTLTVTTALDSGVTPNGILTADGSNNDGVTDADGNPQLLTAGPVVDSGPVIGSAALTVDADGNGSWDESGDVFTVRWSEAADHDDGDDTLDEAQVEALLGLVSGGGAVDLDLGGATVTLDDTTDPTEWTLTLDAAAAGITPDGVLMANGTNNADVSDPDGNPQLLTSGVVVDAGPVIVTTSLTADDGGAGAGWDADGDELTITWSEPASHDADEDGDGAATVTDVEVDRLLGADVTLDGATVALADSGTSKWTLTVSGGDLAPGVAQGADTNGSNNADVTDAAGNPQLLTQDVKLADSGPTIDATALTVDADGDGSWDAPGDVLTIRWTEPSAYVGPTPPQEADVEAMLGPDLLFDTGTVTLDATSDAQAWTLTVDAGDPLATGLAADGTVATNGTNNDSVEEAADDGDPQVATDGVFLDSGPYITAAALTADDASGNLAWDQPGDELTILWSEPASFKRVSPAAPTEAEVEAMLGLAAADLTFGSDTVTLDIDTTDATIWRLTVDESGDALGTGLPANDTLDVEGSNNGDVFEAGGGDPQVRRVSGLKLTAGPLITATALTNDEGGDGVWNEVGDDLRVAWSETATHDAVAMDGSLTESQVRALLGDGSVAYAPGPPASTVTLDQTDGSNWTLTIGGAALTDGVAVDDPTVGSNNAEVTDDDGNPQLKTANEALDRGPVIVRTSLSSNDSADGMTPRWNTAGDVLTIEWSEPATHTDANDVLDEQQVEAILGVLPAGFIAPSDATFDLDHDTDPTEWTLTINTTLTNGVAVDEATNGTNNDEVFEAGTATDGDPQVPTTGVTLGIGPSIESTTLTSDADGDGAWDAVGDVLTIDWSTAATHTVVDDGGMLDESDVNAILGAGSVTFGGTTTVDLTSGDGTATWTLTIGGAPMDGIGMGDGGVGDGEATNGTDNPDVTDDTDLTDDVDGNPQVEVTDVKLGVGPRIDATALTANDGDDVVDDAWLGQWDAVGDELTITWSEDATHARDDGPLTAEEVNAILGPDPAVAYDTDSSVTLAGSGSDRWTLTIGDAGLAPGADVGTATNGSNDTNDTGGVTDGEGNNQTAATDVTLDVGPVIVGTALTTDDDGDGDWNAIDDVLTITWSEEATHAADAEDGMEDGTASLDADQVNAVLGTTVSFGPAVPGPASEVILGGSGMSEWTLTVVDDDLSEGLTADGTADDTNGTNNEEVTEETGVNAFPQVETADVVLDSGPTIVATSLVFNDDADDGDSLEWNAAGDKLEITWSEDAFHTAVDNGDALSENQVNKLLGPESVVFGTGAVQLTSGDGSTSWVLTVTSALSDGLSIAEATNGDNNGAVEDIDGNPQLVTTGKELDSGPVIEATALTNDADVDAAWGALDDELTITWSESATYLPGNGTVGFAEINAILGTNLTAGSATLAGSPGSTWTLTVDGALTSPLATDGSADTNGTNNDNVVESGDDADPQIAGSGVSLGSGPKILSAELTVDFGVNDVWDKSGDVLTVTWSEPALFKGVSSQTTASADEVERLLGVPTGSLDFASTPVTVDPSGGNVWTLSAAADLVDGVTVGAETNGTNNGDVTSDDHGGAQVPTTGKILLDRAGPHIVATAIVSDNGDNTWRSVPDKLRIIWSDDVPQADGSLTADSDVNAILDSAVSFNLNSSVDYTVDGKIWTLTVVGEALASGVPQGTDTNGTGPNPLVVDTDGNQQVATTGVMLDVGPSIQRTSLTHDDGDDAWNAVGDVVTIEWSETATHTSGDGRLTETEVNRVLGTSVDYDVVGGSTVTLSGSGTGTWTLEVGTAALSTGIAGSQATNGTDHALGADNGDVTDDAGNPQIETSDVTLDVPPVIVATALTHDEDGDGQWDEVDDVLTITWSEVAQFKAGTDPASPTQTELNAILNTETPVEYTTGLGGTTVTLDVDADDGSIWTLTIEDSPLVTGVSIGATTNGSDNPDVSDIPDGTTQLPSPTAVELDRGPVIVATALVHDEKPGDASEGDGLWNAVGDKLEVTWSEDASFEGTTFDEEAVEAILGLDSVAFDASGVSFSLDETVADEWVLTIGDADVTNGAPTALEGSATATNGTNNDDVTEAGGDGDPQVKRGGSPDVGVELDRGPVIVATALVHDEKPGDATEGDGLWNAVGDKLKVRWSEGATFKGGTSTAPTEAEVEAILGLDSTAFDAPGVSFSLDETVADEWVLTIGTADVTSGAASVATPTATNGTNNADVTEAVGDGDPQVLTENETLDRGPVITATRLSADDGDRTWNAVGDELTIEWSEDAAHTADAADGNEDGNASLDVSEVNAILGTAVAGAGTTVALDIDPDDTGMDASTWTLTIEATPLATGVAESADTNGTNNSDVFESATDSDGDTQVSTEAIALGVGPHITAAALTHDEDGDGAWGAMNDVLTIEWSENATHSDSDDVLVGTQINGVLGIALTSGQASLGSEPGGTWTLTVTSALSHEVAVTDSIDGDNNADVEDDFGNPQVLADDGVVLDRGPIITAAALTHDDDGDGAWGAASDVLTIEWSENATHTVVDDDGTLTSDQINAVLGTAFTSGDATMNGESSTSWTLTVGTALAGGDSLDVEDATDGDNNADVEDDAGNPQVLADDGVVLDRGPIITAAALTHDDDGDGAWGAVNDVLTIEWSENATHTNLGTDGALTQSQTNAILGTAVTFDGGSPATSVSLDPADNGTSSWTLTIGDAALTDGPSAASTPPDDTNGDNNDEVVDGLGNPQVPTTGEVLVRGPIILATALTSDSNGNGVWDGINDELTIRWSEDATHTSLDPNSTLSELKVEAVLGADIDFGVNTKVTLIQTDDEWAMVVGDEALAVGATAIGTPTATNGANNRDVEDDDGNPQVLSTTTNVGVDRGPVIVGTELTTPGGVGTTAWDEVDDVLTITWSEDAAHTVGDGGELTEQQVQAILGTGVAYTETGVSLTTTTVTLDIDDLSPEIWTLTIGNAPMNGDGVEVGDSTNGTNNDHVTEKDPPGDGDPQVRTQNVALASST